MKIDCFAAFEGLKLSVEPELLQRLNIGDTIRAKVLEITAGELLLKLFDGTVFKAAPMCELQAEKGQVLELTVTGRNEKQVFVETVKPGPAPTTEGAAEKQLMRLGLPATEENLIIAGELASNGISADSEAFEEIKIILKGNSGLNVEKAVFLYKNSILPSEKSIASLIRLTEGKSALGAELDHISRTLLDNLDPDSLENIAALLSRSKSTASEGEGRSAAGGTALFAPAVKQEAPLQSFSGEGPMPAVAEKLVSYIQSSDSLPGETVQKQLAGFLKNNPGVEELFPSGIRHMAHELLKSVIGRLVKDGGPNDKSGLAMLLSENTRRLLEASETIKREFEGLRLRPEHEKADFGEEVKKTFRNIYERLELVRRGLEGTAVGREISARVENLQEDIRFMNELYRHSTYLQLPLNLPGGPAGGELYVLKKGGGKRRIDPKNTTVFISLDTQNLGRFESLVTINKGNITLNVRFDREASIEYFKDNFKELYGRLNKLGYRLSDIRYRTVGSETRLLNADKNLRLLERTGRIDMKI